MMIGKLVIGGVAVLIFASSHTHVSAQGPGGGQGGKPSFDRLLQAFDADANESLSEDEVPGRVWSRLSRADGDGDGEVTREEFDGYKPDGPRGR